MYQRVKVHLLFPDLNHRFPLQKLRVRSVSSCRSRLSEDYELRVLQLCSQIRKCLEIIENEVGVEVDGCSNSLTSDFVQHHCWACEWVEWGRSDYLSPDFLAFQEELYVMSSFQWLEGSPLGPAQHPIEQNYASRRQLNCYRWIISILAYVYLTILRVLPSCWRYIQIGYPKRCPRCRGRCAAATMVGSMGCSTHQALCGTATERCLTKVVFNWGSPLDGGSKGLSDYSFVRSRHFYGRICMWEQHVMCPETEQFYPEFSPFQSCRLQSPPDKSLPPSWLRSPK